MKRIGCPNCKRMIEQVDDETWIFCPYCHYLTGAPLLKVLQECEEKNEYSKAFEIYNYLITKELYNDDIWFILGKILYKQKKYNEAISAFDRVVYDGLSNCPSPHNFQALLYKGKGFYFLENYEQAMKAFNEAIGIHPTDSAIWSSIADTYVKLGENQKALDSINKALEIDPKNEDYSWQKAFILDDLGLNGEGMEVLFQLFDSDPNNVGFIAGRNSLLDDLEPQYESDFTKLTQTGNIQYIENFCKKFPNCKKGTPELIKLHQLLEKKGVVFDESFDDLDLNIIIELVSRQQASKIFKAKMLQNNPKTSEDLIRNFLDIFGDNYNQHLDEVEKILRDDFNYQDKDIHLDISRIQKEIELKNFESCLMSTSQSGEKFTISDIDMMDGIEFELLLKKLFQNMGYLVELTPNTNDMGADLIIEKHGERIVVQAKNWKANVGNSAIQEIFTSIKYYNASKSIVISSSGFTNQAIDLARLNNVEMWDRNKLAQLLNQNPIFKK